MYFNHTIPIYSKQLSHTNQKKGEFKVVAGQDRTGIERKPRWISQDCKIISLPWILSGGPLHTRNPATAKPRLGSQRIYKIRSFRTAACSLKHLLRCFASHAVHKVNHFIEPSILQHDVNATKSLPNHSGTLRTGMLPARLP